MNTDHRSLSRRTFLQGSMLYGAGLLLPVHLKADDDTIGETFYRDLSTYERIVRSRSTPILRVLQAGLASPSAHNVQPWRFLIESESEALLFIDPERLLPETDPYARQILISHGSFLEMARIGGSLVGYRVMDTLFPEGMGREVYNGTKAVARIRVTSDPGIKADELSQWISHRKSDRTPYEPEPVADTIKQALMHQAADFYSKLHLLDQSDDLTYLRNKTLFAFATETNLFAKHEESRKWFRYTDQEIYAKQDGISLRGNGLSGMRLWAARSFYLKEGAESWHSDANKSAGVDLIRNAVESTHLFALLISDGNFPAHQVKTGKDYVRFQLQTAGMGLRIHPLSQILQEYSEMESLRKDFEKFTGTSDGRKVQMLLRVGIGRSSFQSPRRPLDSLIVNSRTGGNLR
jgi:hypothetical protein